MLENANLLIEAWSIYSNDRKYIPIDSEIEELTLSELTKLIKIKSPIIRIIYNNNARSTVNVSSFLGLEVENQYPKNLHVREYVLKELIETIAREKHSKEIYPGHASEKEIRNKSNDAKFALYIILGEEKLQKICNSINEDTTENDIEEIIRSLNLSEYKTEELESKGK